jgi:hypothetical protein
MTALASSPHRMMPPRAWQLDAIVLMPGGQRQRYVCRNRLIGAIIN